MQLCSDPSSASELLSVLQVCAKRLKDRFDSHIATKQQKSQMVAKASFLHMDTD